jgi:hypothetical protein
MSYVPSKRALPPVHSPTDRLRLQSALLPSIKVLVNEPPLGSPTGPLWREIPVSVAFFYISLKL